jgi:hypothetical protein
LQADHEFLLKGDVFTPDVIDTWVTYKTANEIDQVQLRPHPGSSTSTTTSDRRRRRHPGAAAPLPANPDFSIKRRISVPLSDVFSTSQPDRSVRWPA